LTALACPSVAFIYCVLYSFIVEYDGFVGYDYRCDYPVDIPVVTNTALNYLPQRLVWELLITLHAFQRCLSYLVYFALYQRLHPGNTIPWWYRALCGFMVICGLFELIGILITSCVKTSSMHTIGIFI